MLPDRCSVVSDDRQCPNPPRHVVSVASGEDEYMVGVTCAEHKKAVVMKVRLLQESGHVPGGAIRFTVLRAVGTDCVRADPDDTIQIHPAMRDG